MGIMASFAAAWTQWAIHTTWQLAALVALIAALVFPARWLSPRMRYALWLLVTLKVFLPPSLALVWGVGNWGVRPLWNRAQAWMAVSVQRAEPQWPLQPAGAHDALVDAQAAEGAATMATESATPELTAALPAAAATQPAPLPELIRSAGKSWALTQTLFTVWLLGALGFIAFIFARYARFSRLLRRAETITEGPLRVELERLAARLGKENPPDLLLSGAVTTPLLCGLFRPRIVLPSALPQTLAPDELSHVLLHELIHWRRRDVVVGWVQLAGQALFWFHPFVWLANARARHERECACDETALALGDCAPKAYGQSLLKVLLAAEGRSAAALGFLGIFERGARIQNRLEAIMKSATKSRVRIIAEWIVVALFAAIFIPMACVSTAGPKSVSSAGNGKATTAATASEDFLRLLDESQRLFYDWSETQFDGFLDHRDFSTVPQKLRDEIETKALLVFNGPKSNDYYNAINTLGAMRSQKAIAPLLAIATDRSEKDNRDRWMAVRALGVVGDKAVIPDLIHLVYHPNPNTRFWAQITLARLTGKSFGMDWQEWVKWWNAQGGKPTVSSEKVPWSSNAEYMDLEKIKENDRKFIEQIKTVRSKTGAPGAEAKSSFPPRIIATSPEAGATEVDPATAEITVTFDQDMRGGFSWTGGGQYYPPAAEGKKPSWRDKRTCVLPVKLEAGHFYRVGINSTSHQNFRSGNGVPAPPSAIYFATKGASEEVRAMAQKPVVAKMEPANGAKDVDPKITELRVTFNVPMSGGNSWCGAGPNFPAIPQGKRPTWSDDHKTAILPVELKPNWSYQLGLNSPSHKNFCSGGGVPLEPVGYAFTTAP